MEPTLVPYLAANMPKVSADGLTYTITLRKNLKYSDGTPVKASDFGATIERDYKIDSPGVGFFGNIVGTDTIAKTKKGHISGIKADDTAGTITIKLKSPQGDFEYILATEFAAPVPASSPAKDSSTTPLPSTGPYMIQSYKPNKSVVVVRNPNFDVANFGGNVPAGNPDKMTISTLRRPGNRSDTDAAGAGGLRLLPAPERSSRRAAEQVREPDQGLHAGEHVLLLHEQPRRAVRQPQGAAGGQLRDQP